MQEVQLLNHLVTFNNKPKLDELPVGELVCLQRMQFPNTQPSKKSERWLGPRVRHTVLCLLVVPEPLSLVVVQTPGAAQGQWAPPQGPIRSRETLACAACHVVREEVGIDCGQPAYRASCLLEVERDAAKAHQFTHQLFHLVQVAVWRDQVRWSGPVNEHMPTIFPIQDVPRIFQETMRPAKWRMLEQALWRLSAI